MARSHDQTLFERIGGEAAVEQLIDAFYDRVLADPELAPFFRKTSTDKLRRMQREFFAAALDGPILYTGRPISAAHAGRGIETRHVARFVDHLLDTLRDREIDEDDVQDIVSRINTYVDELTGQSTVDG